MGEHVLIMGPPGSGKGTQAVRVCQKRNMAHVSTGDMLRAAMAAGSELGRQVKSVVESGDLVGDRLMLELVADRLEQSDAAEGFMLDGFPRTLPQVDGLLAQLEDSEMELDAVLLLEVPDKVITERMRSRGRTDDVEKTIRHRLDVYRQQTEPVIAHLRARGVEITEVDGVGSMDEITERIEGVLDATD